MEQNTNHPMDQLVHILEQSAMNVDDMHLKVKEFASFLEHLLHTDPNTLLSVLYRVDVSEEKLKRALSENTDNQSAGEIIATLLIDRQLEKIKFRQYYQQQQTKTEE